MASPLLRRSIVFALAFWLVRSTAACGSGPCSELCSCIGENGGDESFCLDQCEASVEAGQGTESECLANLAAVGLDQCAPTCSAFEGGDTTASTSDSGAGAGASSTSSSAGAGASSSSSSGSGGSPSSSSSIASSGAGGFAN